MSSFNKFQGSKSSKFGNEIRQSSNLTNIMRAGISSAIPIWEMLNMSEDDYNLQYHKIDCSGNSVDCSNNETETEVAQENEVEPETEVEPEVEDSSTDASNNPT